MRTAADVAREGASRLLLRERLQVYYVWDRAFMPSSITRPNRIASWAFTLSQAKAIQRARKDMKTFARSSSRSCAASRDRWRLPTLARGGSRPRNCSRH